MKRKIYKLSKEWTIRIASDHKGVSLEMAKDYTDSELREVLRQLNLKADF